jgi:hypothetical protein
MCWWNVRWITDRRELFRRRIEELALPIELVTNADDTHYLVPGAEELERVLRLYHRHGPRFLRRLIDTLLSSLPDPAQVLVQEDARTIRGLRYRSIIARLGGYRRRTRDRRRGGPKTDDQILLEMLRVTPIMLSIMDRTPSAVIVPSDAYAMATYHWLVAAGYRIPRDLSLISFDNSSLVRPWPVSSIDFGFGHLGYQAFHAIIGDLPVKSDAKGDVCARAMVQHYGSVGPARR